MPSRSPGRPKPVCTRKPPLLSPFLALIPLRLAPPVLWLLLGALCRLNPLSIWCNPYLPTYPATCSHACPPVAPCRPDTPAFLPCPASCMFPFMVDALFGPSISLPHAGRNTLQKTCTAAQAKTQTQPPALPPFLQPAVFARAQKPAFLYPRFHPCLLYCRACRACLPTVPAFFSCASH